MTVGVLRCRLTAVGIFFRVSSLLLVACATGAGANAADEVDAPARIVVRGAVDFPSACMPEAETTSDDFLTVAFTVTKSGATTDLRVRESTNPCFNDVALAAVAATRYKPATLNGRPVEQEDVEMTFRFRFDPSAEAPPPVETEDFDARPIKRIPPRYPERCMSRAKSRETVLLSFDVNTEGRTENIRVESSTNSCLDKSAINSVERWEYEPRKRDGVAVRRDNVQTYVTYHLSGGPLPREERVRPAVASALEKVGSKLRRERPPEEILADLEEIEARYGEDFSSTERGYFHQLRGVARVRAGEYEGALDDLRIAERLLVHEKDAREAIRSIIEQLEATGIGATTIENEE